MKGEQGPLLRRGLAGGVLISQTSGLKVTVAGVGGAAVVSSTAVWVESVEDSRTTIGTAGPPGVRQPIGVTDACLNTGLAVCVFSLPLLFTLLPRFMAENLPRSSKYSTLVLIENAEQSEDVAVLIEDAEQSDDVAALIEDAEQSEDVAMALGVLTQSAYVQVL